MVDTGDVGLYLTRFVNVFIHNVIGKAGKLNAPIRCRFRDTLYSNRVSKLVLLRWESPRPSVNREDDIINLDEKAKCVEKLLIASLIPDHR